MKNLFTKTIAILCLTTLLTSCSADLFNSVNGNRNVITKARKVNNDFSGIKVSTGIDLYLTQGNSNKIMVEADENLHDIIITEVKDDILKIYVDKSIWRAKAKKVYVTFTKLDMLKATSGSDVYSKNTIISDEISIAATSGADIKISIDAASATSGSSINAYNLESRNTIAKASSGADINIYASEKLEANASSGGDIDFKGAPKQIRKKTSSGGSVSKK